MLGEHTEAHEGNKRLIFNCKHASQRSRLGGSSHHVDEQVVFEVFQIPAGLHISTFLALLPKAVLHLLQFYFLLEATTRFEGCSTWSQQMNQ